MEEIQFDFGKILIHPSFIVEIINEGVMMDYEQMDLLYQLSSNYYLNRPFGYISCTSSNESELAQSKVKS